MNERIYTADQAARRLAADPVNLEACYSRDGITDSLDFFMSDLEEEAEDIGPCMVFMFGIYTCTENMDPIEPVLQRTTKLSDFGMDEFTRGFVDAMPGWYDFIADSKASCPWCAPWSCLPSSDYYNPCIGAYESGKKWARDCMDEMLSCMNGNPESRERVEEWKAANA